jgi:hypothetical protein
MSDHAGCGTTIAPSQHVNPGLMTFLSLLEQRTGRICLSVAYNDAEMEDRQAAGRFQFFLCREDMVQRLNQLTDTEHAADQMEKD